MKKFLFFTLTFILTISLTGCGETVITELPEDKQGLYIGNCPDNMIDKYCYVYKMESNVMKVKLCNLRYSASQCDFEKDGDGLFRIHTYTIKDLNFSRDDGNGYFNAYNVDNTKEYECNTSFGKIYCSTSTGGSISMSKSS